MYGENTPTIYMYKLGIPWQSLYTETSSFISIGTMELREFNDKKKKNMNKRENIIINPHACAGGVITVSVVCVCVSVPTFSPELWQLWKPNVGKYRKCAKVAST